MKTRSPCCPARLQLNLLDDPYGPQVRIKIDNHIENILQSGENRDNVSDIDRSTVPGLQLTVPQRPFPALVREERRSARSEISEPRMVGDERSKEVR